MGSGGGRLANGSSAPADVEGGKRGRRDRGAGKVPDSSPAGIGVNGSRRSLLKSQGSQPQ